MLRKTILAPHHPRGGALRLNLIESGGKLHPLVGGEGQPPRRLGHWALGIGDNSTFLLDNPSSEQDNPSSESDNSTF
ncbi:hypothetical protein FDUTEX481_05115 [Tolypothrix sp. PCC 7601]|uniref:hypothetical protein n=1 Tax=Tolypothrix sp. LEGE 11397 TaxID=2777971 RepID=UPI0005EAA500|nr:hypothetical protein FDUTEX481_05115 [Tolypothrix sp. PCC 7601]UYD24318.1 hypothetical protein HGR01_22950 [Tolypothrix sp. PCC 7712]